MVPSASRVCRSLSIQLQADYAVKRRVIVALGPLSNLPRGAPKTGIRPLAEFPGSEATVEPSDSPCGPGAQMTRPRAAGVDLSRTVRWMVPRGRVGHSERCSSRKAASVVERPSKPMPCRSTSRFLRRRSREQFPAAQWAIFHRHTHDGRLHPHGQGPSHVPDDRFTLPVAGPPVHLVFAS
jgi:hypothetical protein